MRLFCSLVWLTAAASCAAAKVDRVGGGGGSRGGGAGPGADPGEGALPMFGLPDAAARTDAREHVAGDAICNRLDVTFVREIPTVAIVVDRSSSMFENYGGMSRWAALKSALLDPDNGLIKANEKAIRFGLVMFTAVPSGSCPALEPQVPQLSFTLGAYDAINAVYGPALPPATEKGETPTGETIAAVTEALERVPEKGSKYILLATDGEPDTCPGTCVGTCPVPDRPGWPRDPNCGQDRSLSAVQAAFAKGIRTFVIGLGTAVGAEHLQALANAGAGLPVVLGTQANWLTGSCQYLPSQLTGTYAMSTDMNAPYFQPKDQATLGMALSTVLGAVRSCKVMLKGKVEPTLAYQGEVLLDGKPLGFGDPDGWKVNGPMELEIVGKACRDLETNAQTLNIAFPCAVYFE